MNVILEIEHTRYLMPMEKATKVMQLLGGALKLNLHWEDSSTIHTIQGPPNMEISTIPQGMEIRAEDGTPMKATPVTRATRKLGNGNLKLYAP